MIPARHRTASILCVAGILAVASISQAEESGTFPGLDRLMSAAEYRAAGLDKLSDAERKSLDEWLGRYQAAEPSAQSTSSTGSRRDQQNEKIRSQIVGEFNGWSGKTIFRLKNGQVWRQRQGGRFTYNGDEREVLIDRNFMGFHRMTHVGSGRSVKVTRID